MGDFQTATAALSVVHLAGICIGLIRKAAAARAETKVWLEKIEKVKGVSQNIRIALEKRQNASLPPIPSDLADRIFKSVDECRVCLETMEKKLRPIRGLPELGLRNSIPKSVQYLFTKDKISVQEKAIGDHHSEISLSLTLILCLDQATIYEQGRVTHQEVNKIRELLEIVLNIHHGESQGSSTLNESIELENGIESPTSDQSSSSQAADAIEDDPTLSADELRMQYPTPPQEEQGQALGPAEKLLISGVKRDKLDEVQRLLARDDYVHELYDVDLDDWTVLHHAARRNDPLMLEILLHAGLQDVPDFMDRKSRQGHTALMGVAKHAGTSEAIKMAHLLLEARCNVNYVDESGQSALGCAIEDPPNEHSEEFVKFLLSKRADVMLVAPYMDDNARRRWPEIDEQIRQREDGHQ